MAVNEEAVFCFASTWVVHGSLVNPFLLGDPTPLAGHSFPCSLLLPADFPMEPFDMGQQALFGGEVLGTHLARQTFFILISLVNSLLVNSGTVS